jgi:hypothetical protein
MAASLPWPGGSPLSFLRLEPLRAASMPPGRVLLAYRDVPLGFANNLETRSTTVIRRDGGSGWRPETGARKFYDQLFC